MKNILLAVTVGILSATTIKADPVTYAFSGTGSGSVGGIGFSNAIFSIRVFADTSDVYVNPLDSAVLDVDDIFSQFDIAGIGVGMFTSNERVFVDHSVSGLGFQRGAEPGLDLLDIQNDVFATYDLVSSLGPSFDPSPEAVFQFHNEPSTLGPITFVSARDITFTADVVPEPSTTSFLICVAAIGVVLCLRRKRA